MQTKQSAALVERQALVAQRRGNSARAEQRGQQMAFREAEPNALRQYFGGRTCHGLKATVRTVLHVVPHPTEATPGNRLIIRALSRQLSGQGDNGWGVAVNYGSGCQEFAHGAAALP